MKTIDNFREDRYVRRGYYKLHGNALDENKLEQFDIEERTRYRELGERLELREQQTNTILSTIVGTVFVLGLIWWGISSYQSYTKQKEQEAAQKIEDAKPTVYSSEKDLISAVFPNKPFELKNDPDIDGYPSIVAHNEITSGSSGKGLYNIDVIHYISPFEEIDCMQFLGDTVDAKINLQALDLINLTDGRPTLNYVYKRETDKEPIYIRAAIFTTQHTNICYRIAIVDNPRVEEQTFRQFLNTVQVSDPAK